MPSKQGPALAPDADLGAVAQERGIEFFLVSFVDVLGVLRSKMVPAESIGFIQKEGAGFAPFAAYQNYGPDAADMIAIPDPTSLIQVPFDKSIGFILGDCYINGEKVPDSPRWVLKEQIDKAAKDGHVFKTGVEPEFFLLSSEGQLSISDPADIKAKPCYETGALMRRYKVLTEIINTLNDSGFGVYQTDHEDANGQFEINWHYTDCLKTADRHVFFKWVVKTLAEKHGFRATFMPKPFANKSGNGCHCHCSLWSGEQNIFCAEAAADAAGMQQLGLSVQAFHFLGGIIAKAASIAALTNPTVNSYKRLAPGTTDSGATWAPNRVSFSGNNRTHMVRVPAPDRFELRLADGAVNPYILQATILACGLWGLENKASVEKYFFEPTVNMYLIPEGASEIAHIPRLPPTLSDALRVLEADADLRLILGAGFIESFLKMKTEELQDFSRHVSPWELERTLDC